MGKKDHRHQWSWLLRPPCNLRSGFFYNKEKVRSFTNGIPTKQNFFMMYLLPLLRQGPELERTHNYFLKVH